MRSRVVSSCTWLLCAALAALGAVNCTGDNTPPMPLAPAEPVAFAVHVSYCKDAAVGLDVPGTLVRLVQGSTTLEATSDENGVADFGDIAPGVYDLTVSRETEFADPQAVGGGDVNTLMPFLHAQRTLSACSMEAADVLQDGAVSIADLEALRRFITFDVTGGGHTAQWRFVDVSPQADVREATTLEVHAVLLGDTDLSWPIRL